VRGCCARVWCRCKDYPLYELRKKIALCAERGALFRQRGENIPLGHADATKRRYGGCAVIGAGAGRVEKKGVLDTRSSRGGRKLSRTKQRLTIARALVRNPEILILDDSASALDYATDAALRKSIRHMQGNPTVFIVSQRASSVLYAAQILVLADGHPVGLGTSEELLASCFRLSGNLWYAV
jgi:ABC-type multidrug transport system fused ATPase/permease subunit